MDLTNNQDFKFIISLAYRREQFQVLFVFNQMTQVFICFFVCISSLNLSPPVLLY